MHLKTYGYQQWSFFSGNTGTAGTTQQYRGLQRSLLIQESGNKGTQLCLIKSPPSYFVPDEKKPGTIITSESTVLELLIPLSIVPCVFEISRVNKGERVVSIDRTSVI
jgi:hypothetical protein